jgi:RNA polymerase primary sigma factor
MDVLEDKFQPALDVALLDESLRLEIERALRTLSGREAQVISLYFGLTQEKPLTLEKIGVRFGLTRERVRQIKKKAIRRLKHGSRSETLRDYLN